jgi:glycosyltransferase involved in cell wall biosynthesis
MFFLILFFCGSLCAAEQTLCLNMIVKNEAGIICRCLDSVKEWIDYWVIVDTGSSDGTQEIIREHMKDVPGELHERAWKNWGETRSEAFDLAKGKGDYILFMDADDILEFEPNFEMPHLDADQYNMWRGTAGFSYLKPQVVRGDLPWKWVGVTHEYLDCGKPYATELLEGIHYTSIDDGATRHDPEKYWKNVRLLEAGLKKEPKNERYAFYLAESYRDAGEKAKALEWYQKRIDMGGWAEEVFCSKLQIGHMLKALGLSDAIVTEAYKEAYLYRPHRVEGTYYLAEMYSEQGDYKKAYELIKVRNWIPNPDEKDALFNETWVETYGLSFLCSICSYYVGEYEESLQLCNQLAEMDGVPESWRERAKENRKFSSDKLSESH